ncbi:hypothetical protein [Micromonospora sp. RP3T]|uniref:hypothetical protein n=1 Tax=Micromonospora sp. RP3T TaxID=2135446 RepID=UPI003D7479EA
MSGTGISSRRATRQVARSMVRAQRERTLPATWLGTHGHDDPADDGWQDHMWSHPVFAAGGVVLAGQGVDQLNRHELVDALTLAQVGNFALTVPPGGVLGAAAAGLGLAAGAAGFIATAGARFSDWARAYFTLGPVAAGAYLAYVAGTSAYNVPALAAAAAGTIGAVLGYRRARDEQDNHELEWAARFAIPDPGPTEGAAQPTRPPMPIEPTDPVAREWNKAFNSVGLTGCRFGKKENTRSGFAVLVLFPESGKIGYEAVEGKLGALERNLKMLKDVLDVTPAIHPTSGRELADRCWIHVDVADILSQLLPMPETHEKTTVNEAFRIGMYADGKHMTLTLREISALIIGVRGRGKTNLFHVIVHQLSRCIDVVLWAIDLKGGRAVKPWLSAWLNGAPGPDGKPVRRPVFDWVATTRLEAALMIHAAHALITHRGNVSAGGSKMEPSETSPAVLVLCDEIAALVGKHSGPATSKDWWNPTANQISKVLTLCIQLGRSEAVDFVLFSQRATVTMVGGGDLKSQVEMRIGLGVTNPGDAASVFQNDNVNARKLRRLKHKRTRGACLVETGEDTNHMAGKTFYYGDGADMLARVDRAARAHAMYPADLPLIEQQAIEDALRYLTAPRDKRGTITGDGEYGYGVGPDGAAAERWSVARAEHLYTDGLPDEWEDDDPSDGETLGGASSAAGVPTPRGGGVATATRPAPTTPAAAVPVQRAGQPTVMPGPTPATPPVTPTTEPGESTRGNRYYVRRRDRITDEQPEATSDAVAAAADELFAGLDKGFEEWLAQLPETTEPAQLADDTPEEFTRYDLMVALIRDAGTTGTTPGMVYATMGDRAWSNRQDIYPALRKALADGVIEQPGGRGGRYYHRDHTPTRPGQ